MINPNHNFQEPKYAVPPLLPSEFLEHAFCWTFDLAKLTFFYMPPFFIFVKIIGPVLYEPVPGCFANSEKWYQLVSKEVGSVQISCSLIGFDLDSTLI